MDELHTTSWTSPALRKRFIAISMIALIGLFLYVVSSLLLGVVGGFVLWAMSRGIYEKFLKWTKGRKNLSASLSVLTLFLLVVAPVLLVLSLMANDAVNLTSQGIQFFNELRPRMEGLVSRFSSGENPSFLGYELNIDIVVEKLQEFSGTAAEYLVLAMQKTAGGVASAFLQVFVTLYTLFFLYLDGEKFLDWLKKLLPLEDSETEKLFHRFTVTSISSLKALGIMGVAQGVLGGVAMWICGIPSPFFWTVLLVFATVIPVVGAQIILIPAGVFLILFGEVGYGIGLLLWSWIVVANVDNLLRPYLVGRAVQMHELVVFLTTLGGIAVFGFWGFLIGPVIAALLNVLTEFYIESRNSQAIE
ncbi:MAG: AI-2E family transporter [bacterium]|nr:AI-2E family transporter [bacterium]